MTDQVEIQQTSIARAWRQLGGADVWLQLATRTGDLARFGEAVERANTASAARQDGAEVVGGFPTGTVRGFAVQLIRADTVAAVQAWAADFAAELAAAGLTGKLGGAPSAAPPPCLGSTLPPVPTGYVAYVLDPSADHDPVRREAGWLVSPAATERIAALLDRWARRPGAELVLRQNLYSLAVRLPDAAPQLVRAVTTTGMAGLDFILDKDEYVLHTALSFGGDGVFQVVGSPGGWQQQVELLTGAITALPADTEQAYLRTSNRNQSSHNQLHVVQPLSGIAESDVRYNKHLLDRYLPDAHGVQVVRTAHLDNAHDLSDWQITDLGHGRHLVRAADLAPWYAQPLPEPDTLARARADFAGALLTKQLIADHRPA
ncbi:MAG TPA: hypothetical protein VFD94_01550 [Jatrophihabitans sp.]|nr:hypothetical protein [Jatrophihabitans sp.]